MWTQSTMEKSSLPCLVAITVSFSVYGSCLACSPGMDDNVEGIFGRNINLTCSMTYQCDDFQWDRLIQRGVISLSGDSVQVGPSKSYLPISGISFDDDGGYRCYCYTHFAPIAMCQVHLKTICQATVILNGSMNVYNNSLPNSHSVDVTAGETISIACSEGAILDRNCTIDLLTASDEPTNKFEVLREHNSCLIKCLLRSEDRGSCSVNFTLNVTILEKSTQPSTTPLALTTVVTVSAQPSVKQTPSTIIPNDRSIISATAHTTMPVVQKMEKDNEVPSISGSFPVMLFIGIPIVVFVGLLFIICFFMYFSRSKSTSRQKNPQNLGNESPDTNIPIGPTYVAINKSSPEGDEDSAERGIPCTDDAYDEVGRDVKREPTQQDNSVKAEPSITKDYYSVVNTSNKKLEATDSGSKSDSAVYTEVNKEVKQAGKNAGALSPESSGCNPNVPDVSSDPPYDVLEQPESSEYDAVGVVSTSSALYAVVEKERKKE